MKVSFQIHVNCFHMNGCAPALELIKKLKAIWKWANPSNG